MFNLPLGKVRKQMFFQTGV